MAKSRQLEALIDALNQIRPDPTAETGLATLGKVIGSQYGVAVAQAARIVSQAEIYALAPDLVEAFDRFMVKPKDRDPGCLAKQAIAEALYRLEYSDETLFLKGIRHRQWEPIWGGQVDTAPKLRGTCALGLVRMNYPAVMVELADLLADPDPEARIGAARAVAYSENDMGVALLRLRVKVGELPPVMGECIAALLQLAPAQSLPLAQSLLEAGRKDSDPRQAIETAEIVALVLGESRLPEALPTLQHWWRRTTHPDLRRTALFAIATLRQDEAIQFLLEVLAEGTAREAAEALNALELYRGDQHLWSRLEVIRSTRSDLPSSPE
jgi:hypothetical protein